jgi:hypothetical protein
MVPDAVPSILWDLLIMSVVACAHRGRVTVSKKDAVLVREMHRLIKGQHDPGAQEVVAVAAGGAMGGSTKTKTVGDKTAGGDYMERARRQSVRKL